MNGHWSLILVLVGSFFTLLFIRVPISVALGLSSFFSLCFLYDPLLAAEVVAYKTANALDNFGLLAIPFFTLAGLLMSQGGVARRLVEFAKALAGPLPSALLHCNVLANMLFGSVSGSAVSSAAAVGSMMAPLQKRDGYNGPLCAAVNIASCPSGLLIPPSGTLILYALISGGTSITALFVAGYIPGILMGLLLMSAVYFVTRKSAVATVSGAWSGKECWVTFIRAAPSLFMIVLVMGGMIMGAFTATEASVVSVLYVLILGLIYRELSRQNISEAITQTVNTSCMVLFLVGASTAMSWVLSITGLPQIVSQQLLSITDNPWGILLLMNILLLGVGTFMDLTPALLIFTPIFLPLAKSIGMDPVHFGIMISFNLCIGICTPPVGSALFVGSAVAGEKIERIVPQLVPLFLALFIGLMLVTYWPSLSLFLPRLLGLMGT